MNRYLTLLFILFISFPLWSQQTQFDWALKCGNPPNTSDTRTCMASGADGNFMQISGTRAALHSMTVNSDNRVMMSGQFTEEVTFGTWTLSNFEGFMNFVTCLTGDIFTEIENPDYPFSLNIYPNPSSDVVYIHSPGKIIKAEIFNILGALQSVWIGEDIRLLDVSDLPVGTYFLRIVNDEGISNVGKVVVVK